MLWSKRGGTAFTEGPGAPVDLRSMVGFTGRLLFASNPTGSQMTHVPCTVLTVSRQEVLIELASNEVIPELGAAVILEVAQSTALVQCFTTVKRPYSGSRLALAVPGRPHVLQRRRFPRIDLFTGVALKNAERPLEEFPAQMINLSIDGAACVLAEPVSPGSKLLVNLSPVGLHPPEAMAVVVRCTPTPSHLWVLGLKFQGLAPEQELYLGKYISTYTDVM